MVRILGTCAALALVLSVAFPFAHDAYHRYEVSQKLKSVMTDRERAAFNNWNGDPMSFARSLYATCEQSNGTGSAACEPYRVAIQ
jgi:hypothetical protein